MLNNSQWNLELEHLASIIRKTPLEKTTKWGADVYCWQGKNIVSYGAFKNHFALWFFKGVFLSDPYKVLVRASTQKTKSQRQWRFRAIAEIEEQKILSYINEAIEIEKKGLSVEREKVKELPIPQCLAEKLHQYHELNLAFVQLSPSRKNEYIAYLNEAKQDQTKLKRIDKISPLILQGKGLNDQYKNK